MLGDRGENVYLLPNSIEYYQKELTRMLEFERYEEAASLLRFLLDCRNAVQEREEWQALYQWLVTMFPEALDWEGQPEETEEDMLRQHLNEKIHQDPEYVSKLLQVFDKPESSEKQLLALEQLQYVDHPGIYGILRDWLGRGPIPFSLQFKGLQTLKFRGEKGSIRFWKKGEAVVEDLSDVPETMDELPLPLHEIWSRTIRACEDRAPDVVPFALETWGEFIAYAYGTPLYRRMAALPSGMWNAWAGAFYYAIQKMAHGIADGENVRELFGVSEDETMSWEEAMGVFQSFALDSFPSLY